MEKAVNATTVEVTFKDEVENINSLNFTIEGLTVSNAAVKQSDNKTVVLTTAVQEGGKEYVVSVDNKEIGKFTGVSAVVPTKIDITTQSVQGKTGQQAIVSADVGVKQAGIPVTFNVKADTNNTLNKDQVFEAVTNAEGIATFSYTQYAAGTDQVTAYPTGAPTVRSHAYVFWGVDTILSIVANDKKENTVNNGEDKTYKITYLDPKTGKPIANQRFFVTFEENIDVNIDKTSKATVNGVNPRQLLNNESPIVASVTTDAKGEAVFTVSGLNTAVTPIVFIDNDAKTERETKTYEPSKLQAKADTVTFAAVQSVYSIEVTRDGAEEAAVGSDNGREYTIVVKDKDGKLAANEIVNVAFNEELDRNFNTNTNARFVADYDSNNNPILTTAANNQITVKTNKDGEATFTIVSNDTRDYATPIAWIDINSPNAKNGQFDEGEPFKVAPITYFAEEKLTGGVLAAYDINGNKVPRTAKKVFAGTESATFKYTASNQSGVEFPLPTGYESIDATFTVWNTGGEDVEVTYVVRGTTYSQVVSPNRSFTTPTLSAVAPEVDVTPVGNKTTSVRVVANGTAKPFANRTDLRPINLGSKEAKAEYTSTLSVGEIHTGTVESINTNNKTIKFVGKSAVSYANASFKNVNAVTLKIDEFEALVNANKGTIQVTYKKDGDNVVFEIVSLNPNLSATVEAINESTTPAQVVTALTNSGFTPAFSALNGTQKTTLAAAVLSQRNTGGLTQYSENRLNTVYKAEYANIVAAAINDVNTAATATTLAAVPGLDLTAYNALSAADKTAVETILTAGTFADVAALQAAIPAAIAQNEQNKGQATVDAAVLAINTAFNKVAAAATTAELAAAKTALTTNAADAGTNLTAFNNLTAAQQDTVLDALMTVGGPSTYTAASLQAALNTEVANVTDVTAPTITNAEYNVTTGDLVLTFSENVNVTATGAGTIGFVNSNNQSGTVATPATTAKTGVNKLTISLTKSVADAAGFDVGSKINTITVLDVKDPAGNALVLTGLNIPVVAAQ